MCKRKELSKKLIKELSNELSRDVSKELGERLSNMNKVLEITGLKKRFMNCEALNGVDLAIPAGQIAGLLGPNASGKTTLLKTIAGLYQPTKGSIRYYGDAPHGPSARATVGFCPDAMPFPNWMRVRDAFTYYKDMYPDYSQARADKLMDLLDLTSRQNDHIRSLSKGMKERVILAVTFSRETRLYLLDEPLDGIDPVGKMQVIDAILAMQPEGSSTLISTHMVKDIERIFDRVYFLSKGKVVFSGECDAMREESGKTVEQMYLEVFTREGTV
jgi:ABC-2 type transport system ATP-binding protein